MKVWKRCCAAVTSSPAALSGSANILTGLYAWARERTDLALPYEAFAVATCLFLLYDGGYPLAKSMWPIERRLITHAPAADRYAPPTYAQWLERMGWPQWLQTAHDKAMAALPQNLAPVLDAISKHPADDVSPPSVTLTAQL
jgi:hypothetical protein